MHETKAGRMKDAGGRKLGHLKIQSPQAEPSSRMGDGAQLGCRRFESGEATANQFCLWDSDINMTFICHKALAAPAVEDVSITRQTQTKTGDWRTSPCPKERQDQTHKFSCR